MLPAATYFGSAEGGALPIGVADLRYDDIPATADQLPRIRRALTAWVQHLGVSADDATGVVLATYEAMANVVTHAYPHQQGTFDVHAAYCHDQRYLTITVSDRGRWRLWSSNSATHQGMGLQLIQALAADATVERGARGTTVRLGWHIRGDSSHW